MPTIKPKGARGRPKGSKIVKNRAPVRRSTRVTTAPRTERDEEAVVEHETDKSPAADDSSAEDAAWEVQHQILQDEVAELKNNCSNLEKTLREVQKESARQKKQADNARHISETEINELLTRNIALSERVEQVEADKVQLKEAIEVLKCAHRGRAAPASSSRANPPPTSGRPRASASSIDLDTSSEDEPATQRRHSQQTSGATSSARKWKPQTRTAWADEDARILIELIAKYGPRWAKLERLWKENFPDRHPRDQGQMKDKARNMKVYFLEKNQHLLPGFDAVMIDLKGKDKITQAGLNPYRKEADVDDKGNLFNTYYDEEQG